MSVQEHWAMKSRLCGRWFGIYRFCVLMPSNFVAFFGLVANCNYCRVLSRAARAVDAWTPAWHAQAKVPTLRGSKIAFINFFIIKHVQSSIRAARSRIHLSKINCYVMGETEVKYIYL